MFTHLFRASLLAAAVAGAFLIADVSRAEEAKKPAKAAAAKVEKPKAAPRAPAEYETLDLTDAQKTEIAKIRTEMREAVAKIQKDAKDKELAQLTPEQLTKYKAAEEAKKAAAATKKAPAKEATTKPAAK